MDHSITIQRATTVIDANGTPVNTWTDFATLRAQLVQSSTEEFIRASGASDETIVILRTWWMDGVSNADRILLDGVIHNIKEIKPLGRRAGLEIRAVATGQTS